MTDPLSFTVPTAGVETSRPLLPEGDHVFQISESVPKANAAGTGLNWHKQLNLVNPTTSVDGRPINPNFPMFSDAPLQAKPDAKNPDWFRENIGKIQDAIFGTDKNTRTDLTPELVSAATGKFVVCTIQIKPNDRTGELENRISGWKKFVG